MPCGSSCVRISRSSSSVGGGVSSRDPETRGSHPMFARTSSTVTPGWTVRSVISPVPSSKPNVARSVTTLVGPLPNHPRARSCAGSPECPGEVRKSSRSTNERLACRMMTRILRAWIAISHAPPDPGSRTLGDA